MIVPDIFHNMKQINKQKSHFRVSSHDWKHKKQQFHFLMITAMRVRIHNGVSNQEKLLQKIVSLECNWKTIKSSIVAQTDVNYTMINIDELSISSKVIKTIITPKRIVWFDHRCSIGDEISWRKFGNFSRFLLRDTFEPEWFENKMIFEYLQTL